VVEILSNLYVGNQDDYEYSVKYESGWAVVHACKEPYHRQLLGYRTQGAPKEHPEYFFANRGNRLYLNLVDANDPMYIPKNIIDESLGFINEKLKANMKVLIHCNKGESRSPIIGLLYLASIGHLKSTRFIDAENEYRNVYPYYNAANGMRMFAMKNYSSFHKMHTVF
jgi:predicted protein tyrosine phosphatase